MVDSSNIDPSNKAASSNLAKAKKIDPVNNSSAQINVNKATSSSSNPHYQQASGSQSSLAKDQLMHPHEEFIPQSQKDIELLGTNPILAAKLQNPSKPKLPTKKIKQKPPAPGTKVQFAPKGRAINPRRVKPHLPSRLQSFFDDRIDNLAKLEEALSSANDSVNLINNYARKLLASHGTKEMSSFESLAVLLGLEVDIADLSKDQLIDLLSEKMQEFSSEPQLKEILSEVILQINLSEQNNFLRPLLQFFLPIPFQFEFADVDDEFEEDERETRRREKKKKAKSSDKNTDDDDNEEELEEYDSSTSLSIYTLNYNKIHFFMGYNEESNQLQVSLTGDPAAMELAIPVESNMEDVIYDDLNDINYQIKVWQNNITHPCDKRILKVRAEGKLNPILLKACNSILETIQDSDIDLGDDSNSSYGL